MHPLSRCWLAIGDGLLLLMNRLLSQAACTRTATTWSLKSPTAGGSPLESAPIARAPADVYAASGSSAIAPPTTIKFIRLVALIAMRKLRAPIKNYQTCASAVANSGYTSVKPASVWWVNIECFKNPWCSCCVCMRECQPLFVVTVIFFVMFMFMHVLFPTKLWLGEEKKSDCIKYWIIHQTISNCLYNNSSNFEYKYMYL